MESILWLYKFYVSMNKHQDACASTLCSANVYILYAVVMATASYRLLSIYYCFPFSLLLFTDTCFHMSYTLIIDCLCNKCKFWLKGHSEY